MKPILAENMSSQNLLLPGGIMSLIPLLSKKLLLMAASYLSKKAISVESKSVPTISCDTEGIFLFRKGYLKKYTLGKLDPIYCSSAKLDRAFGFSEVCKRTFGEPDSCILATVALFLLRLLWPPHLPFSDVWIWA